MNIVVAGGTGFIGRAVVRRLLDDPRDGERVAVVTRDPARAGDHDGRVGLLQGFAGDALSMGRAFTGADVVVHAVQFPNHPVEQPARGRSYMQVDGRGTEVAARVAARVGVRRFVYLSGAGAGEGRPQPWFRAKERAEAAVRASGMQHCILRPSWIHGAGDRSMSRLVAFCRYLPVVPVIGDGSTSVQPVAVDDVARCVVDALRRDDASGRTFDLGGPETLSMDEIIRTVQRVLGRSRPLLHHPPGLMKLLALPMLLLPEPILSPGAVDFVLQEVHVDPRPARDYFGFAFARLEDALRAYL